MILNVYKPVGWTSFDVVKKIKNILKVKVGHAGTLDPFAEGVLIVGTGSDTKLLGNIATKNKSYIATLVLGKSTDTLDSEGKINSIKKIPSLSKLDIKNTLEQFKGKTFQTPPMYSAKKVKGVRLYKLARKNISVYREPVLINIFSIKFLSFNSPILKFSLSCSKGTYVRVLGSDIANKLGTVGYLDKLIRTNVGKFNLHDSLKIEDIKIK